MEVHKKKSNVAKGFKLTAKRKHKTFSKHVFFACMCIEKYVNITYLNDFANNASSNLMINRHCNLYCDVYIYLSILPSLQPGMLPVQVLVEDWRPMLKPSFCS